jgi:hypothetical protein
MTTETVANGERIMGDHTSREPADQLDVIDVNTGDVQHVFPAISDGGVTSYEHPDHPGSVVIDTDGQWYSAEVTLGNEVISAKTKWGRTAIDALLERLHERRLRLKACYTCENWKNSGMAEESSAGLQAYCVLTGQPDIENLVHAFHVCTDWSGPRDHRLLPD